MSFFKRHRKKSLDINMPQTTDAYIENNEVCDKNVTINPLVTTFRALLLMKFANSLDTDQARRQVGPDLGANSLTLWWYFRKKNLKKWIS